MEEIFGIFNPWWKSGNVKAELSPQFKRELFFEVVKYLDKRQIIAIFGLRRTGKSTIVFQIIKHILDGGIKPEHILYFSFDEKTSDIKDILSSYSRLHSIDLEKSKLYVFFDEVQKLEDWQNKLKIFYDMYPNIRFFISGSSHFGLIKKASESLGGRINLFKLEPLSFKEWLKLNNFEFEGEKIELYKNELMGYFNWYRKTPFPEIAKLREDILIRKYIDEFVISRVISYDIKKEFKDADIALLETLKDIFFDEIGFILNIDSLARDLQRSKDILIKHINYLAQGLLIKIVRNYRGSMLGSSRKLRRIYPYHPCFCISAEEGRLIENLFISVLDAEFYWRDKEKEVDIVKDKIPIEIKYKNIVRKEEDLKSVYFFMKKFNQKNGIVITKDTEEKIKHDSNEVRLIPAWKWLLQQPLTP